MLAANPATVLAGFGLGLSLIVAIGAQNAYILRQGARREHLLAVLLVCILSDVALILAGVAGFGTLIEHAPWAVVLMRWFGVAFLLGYGVIAAKRNGAEGRPGRRARHPGARRHCDADKTARKSTRTGGRHGPRSHLAEPARVPGHRRAARVGGHHARPGCPLGVRGRSMPRQRGLVRGTRLRCPAAVTVAGLATVLAHPRRHHRGHHAGARCITGPHGLAAAFIIQDIAVPEWRERAK